MNNYDFKVRPLIPPPNFTPPYCKGLETLAKMCFKQYEKVMVHIYTDKKTSFWMFPVKVDDGFAFGYIWRGNKWVFDKIKLNLIKCFY